MCLILKIKGDGVCLKKKKKEGEEQARLPLLYVGWALQKKRPTQFQGLAERPTQKLKKKKKKKMMSPAPADDNGVNSWLAEVWVARGPGDHGQTWLAKGQRPTMGPTRENE